MLCYAIICWAMLCYAMLCYAVDDDDNGRAARLSCEGRTTADKYGVEWRRKPGSAREGGQNGQFSRFCRTVHVCKSTIVEQRAAAGKADRHGRNLKGNDLHYSARKKIGAKIFLPVTSWQQRRPTRG